QTGTGKWVKGVKRYNPVLAGAWITWINPENHKEYVLNGHHRYAMWKNDTSPNRPDNVNVIRIEAANAQEARAVGARINIAEGHGTPLDVAEFIRESGIRPGDLEREGISMKGELAQKGTALAQLAPDLLTKVATGEIPESHGVAIGEVLAGEPEMQREVVSEVTRAKTRLSGDDVREVARQVHAAGAADVSQETLFGGEVGRRPLYVERAQLATAIVKKLGADRRILGFVAQEARARVLAKGGNVIDVGKSRELADQSAQLEELFQRLYTREGPIAKVLTQAAERVARGSKVRAVADDIYTDVANAVQAEIESGAGSGASSENTPAVRSGEPGAETGEVTGEVAKPELVVFSDKNGERTRIPLGGKEPVDAIRVWEKDLFGYSGDNESLFQDENAGKAGAPKATPGGYEAKAKEAREQAAFLKKQLARMGNDPKYIGKTGELRSQIADLERIANFAEKLTTEEVKLQSTGKEPGDTNSLDMFVKEPDIEPAQLTTMVRDLEESIDAHMKGLETLEKQIPPHMLAQFRGLKAGMERVSKELEKQLPAAEKSGKLTPQLRNLVREWSELLFEHSDLTTDWVNDRS
ncbi:MAG: hypothetical protein ACRD16_11745, partial [Thermoanaerobaculia bacterium]